jgi:hypothetical protein
MVIQYLLRIMALLLKDTFQKTKKDVKQEIDVIKVADIPIKRKTKKEFKDEVL